MSRLLVIGTLLFLNGLAWLAGSPVNAAGAGAEGPYGSTFDFELLIAEHASGAAYLHSISGPGSFTLHFDGTPQNLPAYCCGLDVTPSVFNESFTDNGDGTSTVEITAFARNGTDLFPSGLLGADNVLQTDAALRIGYLSGSIPLTWNPPHTVKSATVDMQRTDGTSVFGGPISIDPATFFGAPGPWDGNLAVVFPNQVGKGVTSVDLRIVVPSPNSQGACVADATTLCLSSGRFKVQVAWQALHLGTSGTGQAVSLTSDTGYFWFFGSSNVELVIKVLDGTPVNGQFWVFYGALSDVQYTITVTDTKTGRSKAYFNPQNTLASVADTSAFSASSTAPIAANAISVPAPSAAELLASVAPRAEPAAPAQLASGCTPDATTLCLSSGRFKVQVAWQALYLGTSGVGQAVPLTSDTGYFWFFSSSNVELIIKVLDGTPVNGHFWVFYGALSDVHYVVTVTDTQTGFVKAYVNPDGNLASQADTSAMTGSETPADAIAQVPGTLSTVRRLVDSLGSSSDGPTQLLAAHVQASISALEQCLTTALQTGLAQCPGYDLQTGNAITVAVAAQAAKLAIGLLTTSSGHENATTATTRFSRAAVGNGLPLQCVVPATVALRLGPFCNFLDGTGYSRGFNDAIDDALKVSSLLCAAGGFVSTAPACVLVGGLAQISVTGTILEALACDFTSIVPQAISVQPTPISLGPGESAPFDLQLNMAAKFQVAAPLKGLVGKAIDLLVKQTSFSRVAFTVIASAAVGAALESLNVTPQSACEDSAPASFASARLQPATGTGISLADRMVFVDSGAKPGATAQIAPQTDLNITKTPGVVVVTPVVISPTSKFFPQNGGTGYVDVTAPIVFPWTAAVSREYNWITIISGVSGTGPSPPPVVYSVDANNTGSDRTGSMTIAGLPFTVTQAYVSVSPPSQAFGADGGSRSVKLNAPAGHSWTAVPNDNWITITSSSSGSGPGTVNYSVSPNPITTQRTSGLTWLEQGGPAIATFPITQAGASSSSDPYVGSYLGSYTTTDPGSGPVLPLSGSVAFTVGVRGTTGFYPVNVTQPLLVGASFPYFIPGNGSESFSYGSPDCLFQGDLAVSAGGATTGLGTWLCNAVGAQPHLGSVGTWSVVKQ